MFRLGILQAGSPPKELIEFFPSYSKMFSNLFQHSKKDFIIADYLIYKNQSLSSRDKDNSENFHPCHQLYWNRTKARY